MAQKIAKVCDACLERVPARYRPLFDQFLCEACEQQVRAEGHWRGGRDVGKESEDAGRSDR